LPDDDVIDTDAVVDLAASETAMSRPYCFLLTLAAVAVNYLDCDADDVSRGGTPGSSHVRHRDVMTPASCQQQLSDDIESCSSVYVRLLVSSAALDTKPGQLHHPVARRLCRLAGRPSCP